jgi:hypothetical protein
MIQLMMTHFLKSFAAFSFENLEAVSCLQPDHQLCCFQRAAASLPLSQLINLQSDPQTLLQS